MPFFDDKEGVYDEFKGKCDKKGMKYSFVLAQIIKKWIDESDKSNQLA